MQEGIKQQEASIEQLSEMVHEAIQDKAEVLGMGAGGDTWMPRMFTPKGNKRNLVRQVVPLFNDKGEQVGTKVVWHEKKFNQPQYGDYTSLWRQKNTAPKVDSKRQRKLRGENTQ